MNRFMLAGTVTMAMAGLGAGLAPAQDQPTPAEYQQLRRDFEQMRQRLEQMDAQIQRAEERAAAAQAAVAAAPRGWDGSDRTDGLLLDVSQFKPGWERVRTEGWMEHGKLDQMNVLIGRGGPIDLYFGLNTAGRLQWLVQDDVQIDGNALPDSLEPGFQTAWGSIEALANLYDGALEVYFDIYLSNPAHPDQPQGHEGYMLMRSIPGMEGSLVGDIFEVINVKAGQFEIDYGDHRYRRSDNARVQRNALIGNHVVDPKTTEIGAEIFSAKPGFFNWLVGFGSGSETGSFTDGRGMSAHGKVWLNVNEELRLSGSAYRVHHADTSGARSNLYRTSRDGHTYQGIFTGNAPGQILAGSGQDVLAFQTDVSWIGDVVELYGNVGWIQDDANTFGDEEWLYYGVEGVYRFTERLYAAARYSGGLAQELQGTDSDGAVHRFQIGGGYWVFDTVLFKVEYVHQLYDGFDVANGKVSGVDAFTDPSFNGVIMEVSFSF